MKLLTDMLIIVLMGALAIVAYLFTGLSFTVNDTVRGQLVVSVLLVLLTIVQLAILSVVIKIRDGIIKRKGR